MINMVKSNNYNNHSIHNNLEDGAEQCSVDCCLICYAVVLDNYVQHTYLSHLVYYNYSIDFQSIYNFFSLKPPLYV
jgi:hypothetical protein